MILSEGGGRELFLYLRLLQHTAELPVVLSECGLRGIIPLFEVTLTHCRTTYGIE